ncbi:hypothetical protein ANANG_G00268090 [Anguilla anguilla]|uniref:Uncharacterized protein n=1 Tax=Anguilla anguilla TaxID=7936 RepID=A0A9D3LSY6_ANGAN|nr:hypothetical protein ANANG_G00268090 [Anguilla anguilla]
MPEEALEMLYLPEYAVDMQEKPEKAVKMLLQQTLEMNRFSETDMHELILNVLDIIGFPESADRPADMQEMPQDAEEMVLLSPPEQSTAHTQEETDDGL